MALRNWRFSGCRVLRVRQARAWFPGFVALDGRNTVTAYRSGDNCHLHLAWPVGEAPNPAIRELGEAQSIEEIVEIVRREVEAASPGELVWIPFGPSRVEQIQEKRWPNKDDLDPVSPDNPVILTFAADGIYAINSLALAKANLNRQTPQPYRSGLMGEFEIDSRTGELTGILKGRSAAHLVREPLALSRGRKLNLVTSMHLVKFYQNI